jgi:hypothetical protein
MEPVVTIFFILPASSVPLRTANVLDFALDGKQVKCAERQGQEQSDPVVEHHEGIAERPYDHVRCSVHAPDRNPQCAVMGWTGR